MLNHPMTRLSFYGLSLAVVTGGLYLILSEMAPWIGSVLVIAVITTVFIIGGPYRGGRFINHQVQILKFAALLYGAFLVFSGQDEFLGLMLVILSLVFID
jgi:Na+-translocating ferredoxin:NAD+ oxidoreductase RnfD subunit